jgi:hypothetical protein
MKGKKMNGRELKAQLEKDAELRRKVFKQLVAHLEEGYSLDCFPPCCEKSIKEYLIRYPEEWIEEDFVNAMRSGKQGWEGIGRRQATGECLGNSRSWQYNMSNRYRWRDKVDIEQETRGQVQVSVVSYCSKKTDKTKDQMSTAPHGVVSEVIP